jgi:2-keto-4-pentenoate hydratase/2-oxohepta-3-ene-1,7-dioic acid hydratase in catechol pathway
MVRLACTSEGTPLIGDTDGFLPLSAAAPSLQSTMDALPLAASNSLPDPSNSPSKKLKTENMSLGIPLESLEKIWGIGLNYADHAADLDEVRPMAPASFMKPATSAVGPGGPIRLPDYEKTERVTAEGELGIVIGRCCSDIDVEQADEVIAGFVPIIDMTAEDILERNPRFLTRSKSFDSFLVIGPWVTTTDEMPALKDVTVQTIINGKEVASDTVRNMMTPPKELVAFHSNIMTLHPGDVILTGTPGAGLISSGDEVRASVGGVGEVSALVV